MVAVVATAVAVGAALGCTGDDDPDVASTTAPAGDPTRVPAAFAHVSEGWAVVGATNDLLVGLGGPPADDGDRIGQTFDLATGELADIPPPPFDDARPVQVDTAVFGSTLVTVDAFVFGHGIDADTVPVDSGYTPPTDLLSYRLDPRDRTWERLALPDGFEDVERGALWEIDAVGADGAAAAIVAPHSDEAILATIDGDDDSWRLVARDIAPRISAEHCATDTEWWQLRTETSTGEVSVLSLETGESRPVETPPLVADLVIGGHVGCSADRAVIAVHGSGDTPAGLYVSRPDGSWGDRHDAYDAAAVFVEGLLDGGASGPIVLAGDMGSDLEHEPTSVVLDSAGRPVPLDVDKRSERPIWRGRTSSYLVLGPRAPESEDEGPVGIRLVEVP